MYEELKHQKKSSNVTFNWEDNCEKIFPEDLQMGNRHAKNVQKVIRKI